MEAIPNGELFDLITAEGQAMTDGTMRRLVHGIINGMAELCALGPWGMGMGGCALGDGMGNGGWIWMDEISQSRSLTPGIREWSKIWSDWSDR